MKITRSKYGAKKTVVDWIKFDSKIEAEYYLYLKVNNKEHIIQPKYLLQEWFVANDWTKIQPINYIADFAYDNIVVDIKGLPTEWAKLKRKMFLYRYPELKLKWLVRYKWEWIDYFENEKRKKENKKAKKVL